jgi:predicted ATP-dependent endonuclease of OLD family
MHLQRIQVPDFRVLKDVDITFEKELSPRVFPLGSQNGGGKSTLLQLIFVLLHCSTHPERLPALKNILHGFKVDEGKDKRVLAKIDIWDGNKSIGLEFFCCRDSYANRLLNPNESDNNGQDKDENTINFSDILKAENLKKRITEFEQEREELKSILQFLALLSNSTDLTHKRRLFFQHQSLLDKFNNTEFEKSLTIDNLMGIGTDSIKELRTNLTTWLGDIHNKTEVKYITLSENAKEILKCLESKDLKYICNYTSSSNGNEVEVVLCQTENLHLEEISSFFNILSSKVFLASPLTQVFILLSQENRKLIFQKRNDSSLDKSYYLHLDEAKTLLSGFFTYDYLAVDVIVESFKAARDKDFKRALETGEYGNSYKELLDELKSLMTNKEVNLKQDLSGVTFKMERDGETVELNPEDLSHGELKRLSIYMWLKYLDIKDAIVLMDEIEIALHPDWQYRIVSDLTEWASSNQYILATHSYELCQALTPSHVKELEPRLTRQLQSI